MTYDSAQGDSFVVHKDDELLHFICSNNGLYYHDMTNRQITLLNAVSENMEGFYEQQITKAKKARDLYAMVGYPTIRDFKAMIKNNMLLNCPVTTDDIDNSVKIFGPDIHMLKGKTVRKQPISVKVDYIKIPKEIQRIHHNVILAIDLFYVNNLPFFVTVS